jgi:hypothetical protein
MKEITTSTINVSKENRNAVKKHLIGTGVTIGLFYEEAANLLINQQNFNNQHGTTQAQNKTR